MSRAGGTDTLAEAQGGTHTWGRNRAAVTKTTTSHPVIFRISQMRKPRTQEVKVTAQRPQVKAAQDSVGATPEGRLRRGQRRASPPGVNVCSSFRRWGRVRAGYQGAGREGGKGASRAVLSPSEAQARGNLGLNKKVWGGARVPRGCLPHRPQGGTCRASGFGGGGKGRKREGN